MCRVGDSGVQFRDIVENDCCVWIDNEGLAGFSAGFVYCYNPVDVLSGALYGMKAVGMRGEFFDKF